MDKYEAFRNTSDDEFVTEDTIMFNDAQEAHEFMNDVACSKEGRKIKRVIVIFDTI